MAWVREKNPKRKTSAQQRDPKEALEGLLSYLACKPAPGTNIQRYLRETSPHKYEHDKPEIVQHEPTVYDEEEEPDEDNCQAASVRNPRRRDHQHHHHHHPSQESETLRTTPAPRHVSSGERGPYRPKTSVQTRRVVSSWSNATTPLVI